MTKKILILGGDGYLGWPTAMTLANKGYDVAVVDNYLRRNLSKDYSVEPLFEVPDLDERINIFKQKTGKNIKCYIGDCCNYSFLKKIVSEFLPDSIVHYAEQPSAPFSMKGFEEATLTLNNNLNSTLNVIYVVKELVPDCHIIKLGTMGEYGTPNIDIPEGWIEIEKNGKKDNFLFPRQASSLYHTTKIQDTDLLWFYVRNNKLRVTDLMQGPVYGITTQETELDSRLLPFLNYDDLFGTVVNRFLVQAVAGIPLTIYGKGNQIRGYLNLKDTIQCVELAIENPVQNGDLKIYNQITETFSVNQLAQMVKKVGDKLGLDVSINYIENPRNESEEHYYNPTYSGLKQLGLKPNYLSEEVIEDFLKIIIKFKNKINTEIIMPKVKW